MSKLHELLAIEGDLAGIAKKITDEILSTFKKPDHFIGQHRKLEMFDAAEQSKVVADEYKEIVTTVPKKLSYLSESIIRYFDAVLQKETTNQQAKADLVVDGITIAKDVPATFLLGMESKLKELRSVFESTPTLAPGVAWEKDLAQGNDIYRMKYADEKLKTAKSFMHKVLYEATDKHPAQIEKWEEQTPVGRYITNTTCGMLSPADKSIYLGRIDKLIQAVKKARMQANMVDVVNVTCGDEIFKYIFG